MERATNSQTGGEATLTAVTLDADTPTALEGFASRIKLALINAVPLATLLAVVAFWLLAPRSFTTSEWSLVIVTSAITLFILGLEFVLERHPGWRLSIYEQFMFPFQPLLDEASAARAKTADADG
ncbi:hypothetical protein [Aurantiacibacter suaedae]|uniref:hypothetical protein n=1 Tax=Aurantiacibacter suaedae TaxID=2545755 RepID=UPI0010FA1A8F|nr:hypothetical protein [Aurantiacibacter suaedae]